jgi:hypothetical protein
MIGLLSRNFLSLLVGCWTASFFLSFSNPPVPFAIPHPKISDCHNMAIISSHPLFGFWDVKYLKGAKNKVTICPEVLETVPEIRLTYQINFIPDFAPFFPLLFHLPHNFRIENFLHLVSDFHDEEIATVLHTEQL